MQQRFSKSELKIIDEMLDMAQQVVFWLDIDGDEDFIFRKFNRHYTEYVGFDTDALVGRTPHQALPARQADTVAKNYEACRSSGEPYVYEELLELGDKTLWWKTTLSPIKNARGEVVSILGVAVDITDFKQRDFDASALQAQLGALNEDLRMFTSMAVQDMRGPFMTIMGLLNFIKDGFVDLGDGKHDMLAYCEKICATGMTQMDAILQRAQAFDVSTDPLGDLDLEHLCGDLCALVDPDKRFDIRFPKMTVNTDRVALQLILRTMVENAMQYCEEKIEIEVSDYGDGRIFVSVYDDGPGDNANFRPDGTPILPKAERGSSYTGLSLVRDLITERDGELEARRTDRRQGVEITFSLPGKIAEVASPELASHKLAEMQSPLRSGIRLVS